MLRLLFVGILGWQIIPIACTQPKINDSEAYDELQQDPYISVVPFRLIDNTIYVWATIDGQSGYVLLDSGSPSAILNEQYFPNKRIDGEDFYSDDLTGGMENVKKTTVRLQLDKIDRRSQEAFLMDLTHIEKNKNIELLAILGYHFFGRYEMVIDYQDKMLTFFSLNRKGKRKSTYSIHTQPDEVIQAKRSRHLLYIQARVGSTNLKLGIDCGAELSIFDKRLSPDIGMYFSLTDSVNIVAMTNHTVSSKVGSMASVQIGQRTCELDEVILADLSRLNRHLVTRLDGLLGYDFLSDRKIGLNFKRKTLAIWESNIELPIYAKKSPLKQ